MLEVRGAPIANVLSNSNEMTRWAMGDQNAALLASKQANDGPCPAAAMFNTVKVNTRHAGR